MHTIRQSLREPCRKKPPAGQRAAKKQGQTKMHLTSTSAILFTTLSDTTMRRSAFRHGMNLILYTFHSIYFDDK